MIDKVGQLQHFRTLRGANLNRQKEWDKHAQIDASYRGCELAGEVGEACNLIKKLERERLGIPGTRATVAELANELGDVVIAADLVAMMYCIELLGSAVPDKFNITSTKMQLLTRLTPQKENIYD